MRDLPEQTRARAQSNSKDSNSNMNCWNFRTRFHCKTKRSDEAWPRRSSRRFDSSRLTGEQEKEVSSHSDPAQNGHL
jgi:hypothetical protein